MMTFINKYSRWFFLVLFLAIFILLFFPIYPKEERTLYMLGTALFFPFMLFSPAPIYIIGEIFVILGIVSFVIIFLISIIKKKQIHSHSLPFVFILIAEIIKLISLYEIFCCDPYFAPYTDIFTDIAPDYIIITIALLMLIVDIVRLSLYIRAHKDAIHAKAADISAWLKTKLQREHKPTKDERIAELEERVRQLEDKRDE